MYQSAGYQIQSIGVGTCTGNGLSVPCATITSQYDCQWFSGSPIYIAGNSNPALNGIRQACPPPSPTMPALSCIPYQLQLPIPTTIRTGPNSGIVWSGNYWPITMPFAVLHGVTSIEVWECDLDYAFDVETTQWQSQEGQGAGCAGWGVQGPDYGYQNAAADTQIAQPSSTSVRAGSNILVNGTQF